MKESPMKVEGKHPLIGQYFHVLKNGKISRQGVVLEVLEGEWLFCQLFEWLMGEPSFRIIQNINDCAILGWQFYEDAEAMNEYWKQHKDQQ